VKLNLKVGIFISDNTDLWLTDASYSGFGTDLDVITGKFYVCRVLRPVMVEDGILVVETHLFGPYFT
jgi:hypothetical protein